MTDKNSEKNQDAIRRQASDVLKLNLTDEEIETLLAGRTVAFGELTQKRSLSEIGMALIRADAFNHLRRNADSGEHEEQADDEICVGRLCIRFKKGLELRLNSDQT